MHSCLNSKGNTQWPFQDVILYRIYLLCQAHISSHLKLTPPPLKSSCMICSMSVWLVMLSSLRNLFWWSTGSLHGHCWVISIQLFSFWCTFLCRDCSPCCLSPYPSEQGKQGIQGKTILLIFHLMVVIEKMEEKIKPPPTPKREWRNKLN